MEAYEIRPLRSGDEHSLLATFNHVFGARDPAFRARTLDEWSWAFERNPAGQRVFLALHAGQVVAQYAALPVHVWIDGSRRVFAQIVDSMVHPEHRGNRTKPSLFVETARAFFAQYGGPTQDWVHYGWPITPVQRIGEHHLEYDTLRTQLVLVRELAGAPAPATRADAPEVVAIERFDEQARWLWDRCSDELRISAIRDDAHLNWRFVDHPRHSYARHGVRDAHGTLRGLCIARRADFVQRNLWCIAEWLVPFAETAVGEALLGRTLESARAARAHAVALILPEWSPWHRWFQERGFLAQPTPYRTVARPFHPRCELTRLRANWWYQWGDSDLV
jgi:hypothetical protein